MIKIIEEGRTPKKRYTCGDCGCIFLYDEEDLIRVKSPSLNKNNIPAIKCPWCKKISVFI